MTIIITTMLVSGCNYDPVLAGIKDKEIIGAPMAFGIFMLIIITFSLRPQKSKKKLKTK